MIQKNQIRIQIIFINVSDINSMFSLALQTLLSPQYNFSSVHVYINNILFPISVIFQIPMTLVIPLWDLKILSLRLSYDMNLRILIFDTIQFSRCIILNIHTSCNWVLIWNGHIKFNTLQFLYCVISNNHTWCDSLNWIKTVVLVSIYIYIYYIEL